MAIGMIDRSCFEQALETLRGAAFAFKCATKITTATDVDIQIVSNRLEYAYHCVAEPQISEKRAAIQVISQDKAICFAQSDLNAEIPMIPVVRIEANDSSSFGDQEHGSTTAIIIYNMAVASFCQSQCEKRANHASRLYRSAIELLGLCHQLLQAVLDEANCDNYLSMPLEIGLSSLSLKVLFHALKALGGSNDATISGLVEAHARLNFVARTSNSLLSFTDMAAAAA